MAKFFPAYLDTIFYEVFKFIEISHFKVVKVMAYIAN